MKAKEGFFGHSNAERIHHRQANTIRNYKYSPLSGKKIIIYGDLGLNQNMKSFKTSYFMGLYKDIVIYIPLSMINCLKTNQKQCVWGLSYV